MKIWLTTILRGFGLLAGIALAVPAASAASLAAGYDFAGSIDSTGVLRTWGDNDFGQLGQGSATTTSVSQPAPVAGSHHWSGVAMGQDFTLAFDTAGALWAWGNNTSGQLGIGGTATTSSPVKVSLPAGSVVQAVAAGQAFSVALVNVGADHGRIYAWGGNSYGQLGQGSADNNVHATPLWVGSTSSRRYTSITATGLAVVAIATDGSLWAWGDNSFGETGQGGTAGSPFNLSVPTQVGTATGWTSVSGGYGHVLALQGTALWAWGFNGEGQVGNGAVGPSVTTPTQIAATQSWAAVGAGQYHSFAVDSSGNLWAWGLNDYGELDLPISETTANEFSTPQATGLEPGLAPWSAVVGGEFFTVARNAAGGVYAVGDDTFGELGNDTINSALNFTPAFVQALVGGVNLTVAAPLVPSATLGVNAVAQPVTVTVQNTGSATETGSFVVGVYLSSDGVIDSGALLLASATQSPPLVSLGSVTVTFSGANLAIPGVPPGAYQLISQVTPVGGNPVNGGATAVTLVGPDLTFQSLAVGGPTNVAVGAQFTDVTATLRNGNLGVVPAVSAGGTPLVINVWLGTQSTHTSGDIQIGQFTYSGGLAANASVALPAQNFTVPSSVTGGVYELFYTVNDDNAVAETGNLPDFTATTVSVQSYELAASAPQVVGILAGTAPTLGTNATIGQINVSAQNLGTQAYGAGFTVSLYLSADGLIDANAVLLASLTDATTLNPNSSKQEVFTNVVVPLVAPGSYQLLGNITPAPGNADPDPANNTAGVGVSVVGPDLALGNPVLAGGNTALPGGSFTGVTYQLSNLNAGVLPVGTQLLVQTYLSTSATFSPSTSTLLDSYTYSGGIAAGPAAGSVVALPPSPRTINVPAGTPGGAYNLFIVINGNSAITESALGTSLINNVLAVPVTIYTVDLAVTAPVTATTSAGLNSKLSTVSTFVANYGTLTYSAGYTLNLYLSASSTLDGTATLLQSSTQSGSLAPQASVAFNWTNVAIPNVSPGSYFLLSQVVLASGQVDSNPASNVASSPLTVVGSDLSLTNAVLSGGTTTVPGGSFTGVTYQLNNLNTGIVPAGTALLVQTFLSTAATFNTATATLLDSYTYSGGIAAGPAAVALPPAPRTITVPAGTPGGAYNLFFVVDGNNAVAESALGAGTVNNVLAVPVTVSTTDLAVTVPATATTSLGVNATLGSVSTFVENETALTYSAGYTLNLYLSASSVLDGTATLLQSSTQSGALAPQSSVAFSWSNVAIPNVTPGTYFLLSQVVLAAGQTDGNPSNNVATTQVTVVGSDLTLTNAVLSGGTTTVPGGSFTGLTYQLNNLNAGVIPPGTPLLVQTFLSTSATFNAASATLLDSYTYSGGIAAGPAAVALPPAPRTIAVPAGTAGGAYNLLIVVNNNNVVVESAVGTGTISNTLAVPVTIGSVDLAVTTPTTATTSIGVNTKLATVSTFVENVGAVNYSAGYTLNLYLSASATLDGTATLLQSSTQPGPLAPLASAAFNWTNVAIPNVVPGSYYLLSQVVLAAGQTDGNPANNVAATPVTIVAPAFTVGNFVFPNTTSIAAGGSFGNVTYTVTNSGAGAVPAFNNLTIQVYLSTTTTLSTTADTLLDQYEYTGGIGAGGSVTLPSPAHAINLPANTPNGVYQLLFVVNGDGAVAGAPVSVTAQQVAVGAINASVTAPALTSSSVGVNTTLPSTTITVNNLGGFAIPAGTVVNLYLSADANVDLGDPLLGTQIIASQIAAGASRPVTFTGLNVPDFGQGPFYLVAQIVLPTGLIDLNPASNVAATPITLERPTLSVSSVNVTQTLNLNLTSTFSNVTFTLGDTSLGAVPAGTAVLLEVYLATNPVLNPSSETLLYSTEYVGGLGGTSSVIPPAFSFSVPAGTVGGSYYLIFAANRDRNVNESSTVVATDAVGVTLQKTNAPGQALGYGNYSLSGAGQWFSQTDPRASTGHAFQSPVLAQTQSASLTLTVSGPTLINAPWLIVGSGASDTVTYTVDGAAPAALTSGSLVNGEQYKILTYNGTDDFTNVGAASNAAGVVFVATGTTPNSWTGSQLQPVSTLTGFKPSYQPSLISVPVGTHTIIWTYNQNSPTTTDYARVDLQLPFFTATGDASWFGVSAAVTPPPYPLPNLPPPAAPLTTYAESPALLAGQQANLQVGVTGPALVSFWWSTLSVANEDTLGFYIDGQPASMPTHTFFTPAAPAAISGDNPWAEVVFLVGPGTHTLSWIYSQNSTTATSAGYVAGLQVLSPVPPTNSPNYTTTTSAQYAAVPPSNVDLAITNVTAATGTYLLDDAAGTGVLPVSITVTDVGANFASSPNWDAADLEIHLSTDTVFGNADDIDLGSFASLDAVAEGNQVVFQGDIDLPFDIPAGNYYLLIEYGGSSAQPEFTLANATATLGPGYLITRAPRLVLNNFSGLAPNYPYHPQDGVYLTYNLGNIGLADVDPSTPFQVQVSLMAVAAGSTTFTNGTVVNAYPPVTYSVFLPQVSAEYPNGGTAPITNYLNLPDLRDTLVALGIIPAGTPEDSGPVYINASALSGYEFYWQIVVDPGNVIVQSSTANVWTFTDTFSMTSVPTELNVGQYFGQAAFGSYVSTESAVLSGTTYNAAAAPASANGLFTSLIKAYATGQSLAGSPQTLFQTTNQNGFPSLTIPPGLTGNYLTQTFDFNVRANDIAIDVQSSPDLVNWSTLVTLSPPYSGTAGTQSLTGNGGLLDNPYVLAVDGNSTSVEEDYLAQVTVRDSVPIASSSSRFMRLNIRSLVAAPAAPSNFLATYDTTTSLSDLSWTGTLPTEQDPLASPGILIPAGAYVIERASSVTPTVFAVVGSSTSTTYSESLTTAGTYIYRIRAITTGGASTTVTASETVPAVP
jgi:alpha-tubulin suppressor-like RCC1 family protein